MKLEEISFIPVFPLYGESYATETFPLELNTSQLTFASACLTRFSVSDYQQLHTDVGHHHRVQETGLCEGNFG